MNKTRIVKTCPDCRTRMRLITKKSAGTTAEVRKYECPGCGAIRSLNLAANHLREGPDLTSSMM